MNTKRHIQLSVLLALASLLGIADIHAAAFAPFGTWNFDSGNLSATVGSDLLYADGGGGLTAARTVFGPTTSFCIPDIGGSPANIMCFPACTNGMGYSMTAPPANGGSSITVNQYSLVMDLFYPTASVGKIRPLIRTHDGTALGSQQFIVINANGTVGPAKIGGGGFSGPSTTSALQGDTWYRLGLVVSLTTATSGKIVVYANGVELGTINLSGASAGVDGYFALTASTDHLIFADSSTNAAKGYVNSLQLHSDALSPCQMQALGGPAAAGIPTFLPPLQACVSSRTPGAGATGVSEEPVITVVLDQGASTVTGSSVQLYLDGVPVGSVVQTPPTFTATYTVPPRLDPQSTHTLQLKWTDSNIPNNSSTWFFTVQNYQVVNLPAPFYLETFDSLVENATNGVALPAGWTVQNQTSPGTAGYDLANRNSDSYKDWILISSNRFSGWDANRTALPTIILNGTKVTSLCSGNLLWSESDSRCGGCNGQFSDLFTAPINCTGRTNVFVSWNSIYMQNQDNMDFMEYSIDGGANWLPVMYMFDDDPSQPADLILLPNGTVDVYTSFARIDVNRNWSPLCCTAVATNYGSYIYAPTNIIKPTDCVGRFNDSNLDGKRIEVVRLPKADGQPSVKFRLNANGTSSWFWGIDNFGLYEISTPVFTTQPAAATIAVGGSASFTVVASSPTAVTYQWQHAGTNISNGGHYSGVNTATLTVANADPNDAGGYRCKATNADGPTTSNPANLNVVAAPTFTPPSPAPATQQPDSVVASDGYPVSFSGSAFGATPLSYRWYLNGSSVGTGTQYSLGSAHAANAGSYTLVVTNLYGAVTSRVARLSVVNVPITDSLVGHYKFDSDYTDSSGHNNHATPINGPSLVTGKIGNAMQFTTSEGVVPDVTNFASLGYPPDLQFGCTVDYSVSLWVNITNQSDDLAFISNSQWDSSGNVGWGIFSQGGGNLRVKVTGTGGSKSDVTVPNIIRGNGWHHILVSFQQGGAMYTMLDGALLRTTAWTPTGTTDTYADPYTRTITNVVFSGTSSVNIGQDGTGWYNDKNGGAITNGLIDDVGIWRRAVSPQEALAIYNAGQVGQSLELAATPGTLGILTITLSGGNVQFAWVGGTGIRLQRSTTLAPGSFVDVGGTLGNSSYSEPAASFTKAFYRLFKP
jgi:hypothetical protein